MSFVEHHEALYEAELDAGLPGDTIRMRVRADDAADDVAERHHTVEFMSLTGEGHWARQGCIGHSMKEIETLQGAHVEIESSFEVVGSGVRDGRFAPDEVESVVQAELDKLKAARLLPLHAGSLAPVESTTPQA